ncbi:MAG: type II toxin-antitoxin system HicB family antitoxin [Planctomycetota bacterium]
MSHELSYTINLQREPEGGYTVVVPALPGCISYGETYEEALMMAKKAIRCHVEGLQQIGGEIPVEPLNTARISVPLRGAASA